MLSVVISKDEEAVDDVKAVGAVEAVVEVEGAEDVLAAAASALSYNEGRDSDEVVLTSSVIAGASGLAGVGSASRWAKTFDGMVMKRRS